MLPFEELEEKLRQRKSKIPIYNGFIQGSISFFQDKIYFLVTTNDNTYVIKIVEDENYFDLKNDKPVKRKLRDHEKNIKKLLKKLRIDANILKKAFSLELEIDHDVSRFNMSNKIVDFIAELYNLDTEFIGHST